MKGIGASPGVAVGPALVLRSFEARAETASSGFVLVVRHSMPEWAVVMDRAVAVVSETGGVTSHLASIARELGIPCVVGVPRATSDIPDGAWLRVSGFTGDVVLISSTTSGRSG